MGVRLTVTRKKGWSWEHKFSAGTGFELRTCLSCDCDIHVFVLLVHSTGWFCSVTCYIIFLIFFINNRFLDYGFCIRLWGVLVVKFKIFWSLNLWENPFILEIPTFASVSFHPYSSEDPEFILVELYRRRKEKRNRSMTYDPKDSKRRVK